MNGPDLLRVGLEAPVVGIKYSMKRLLQFPASRFLPPSSGFLPPGLGTCPQVWVPAPRSGSLPPGLGPYPRVWVLPSADLAE